MKLSDYLIPVNKSDLNYLTSESGYLGSQINSLKKGLIPEGVQVAIIGINTTANSYIENHCFNADQIRKYLYQLSGFSNLKIVDLGNVKPCKTVSDSYAAVKELTENILQKGVIPLFIGGTQEFSLPIAESVKKCMKKLEVTFIDALVDFKNDKDYHSQSYLSHEFFQSDNSIIRSVLGIQSYFSPIQQISTLSDKGFNFYRLGAIRNKFQAIEPILRDTNFCSFDMSSIRQSDAPAVSFKSPNGLYAEEACQMANMTGMSDNLKAIFLGEIDTELDVTGQTTHLMSQVAWHFLQGLSMRKGDYPERKLDEYKKIYVTNSKSGFELLFYQNNENKRFWVKLPGDDGEVISCSEFDYKAVCFNEIPERIWKRISNTIK